MPVAIASDHAGFRYKCMVMEYLRRAGHEVVDFGTDSERPVDYPDPPKQRNRSGIDAQLRSQLALQRDRLVAS